MAIDDLIRAAEALLPGLPAPEGERDPRWRAIVEIGGHVASEPEAIWPFVARWGSHEQFDLRAAIAACVLGHLLDAHFAAIFPRVHALALADPFFAETFCMCSKLGQSNEPGNSEQFDALLLRFRWRWAG